MIVSAIPTDAAKALEAVGRAVEEVRDLNRKRFALPLDEHRTHSDVSAIND